MVIAMKNDRSIAGIIIADSKVLVAHRLPTGQMGGKWEFPGGKVESGETDEQTIVREFSEEFGISVVPGKFLASAEFSHNNRTVILHAYEVFVQPGQEDSSKWKLSEHSEIAWIPLADVKKLDFVDSDLKIYNAVLAHYEK